MDAQVARLVAVRCTPAAISRRARLAQASRRSGERSSQELAFQLTDAQFSVITVATPGKPGVVIDRIAYSPYGEATRTLRSDVNGDGFVNKDDYAGIIKPRTGAAIGTAAYVVEADLDRDGKITQTDYDISIADDGKSSSGGVGEAGLFSRGVRNSIGYCGYVFNEDSGLYTVRFRTYSPTLGRWLERDPAGYVDGANTYAYLNSGPIGSVDPTGLFDAAAHYYGTYIAAICSGKWDVDGAMNLAYYTQYSDQVEEFDAYSLYWRSWGNFFSQFDEDLKGAARLANRRRIEAEERWMYDVMRVLHSLDGGDPSARRACLGKLILGGGLNAQEMGSILHAFGDAFAHTYHRDDGVVVSHDAPRGHGWDTFTGNCPDNACKNPNKVKSYMIKACEALGGHPLRCASCVGRIDLSKVPSDDPQEYLGWFRGQAIHKDNGFKFPENGWHPGHYNTDPSRPPISQAEMAAIIKKIRCACPRVSPPPERPARRAIPSDPAPAGRVPGWLAPKH